MEFHGYNEDMERRNIQNKYHFCKLKKFLNYILDQLYYIYFTITEHASMDVLHISNYMCLAFGK